MKIYIAHNFEARTIIRDSVVPRLHDAGHKITSRWLYIINNGEGSVVEALEDIVDIDACDVFMFFSLPFGGKPGKGKFFELGYAVKANKKVVICGDDTKSCIFYNLPNITHVNNLDDFISLLSLQVPTVQS